MTLTTTCVRCGQQVLADDRFCAGCGAPQAGVGSTPVSGGPKRSTSGWDRVLEQLRQATLGEYIIESELGRGGMAAVFLAYDIALERKVAIKVMSPALLLGEGMVERFKQEATVMARLSHPHIITVHAVKESDQLHYLVMKYVEGRPLDEVIRETGALPVPIVRAILFQVGSALNYAHRRGIVHRDVKPANIMLDDDGNVVVTDFGIAKVAQSPSLTITGGTVGTAAYMSPEQCEARDVTGASDQYSLGIVAYEMLTGKPPFDGTTLAIMLAHTREAPPVIEDACPDCPPALRSAIARMLEKHPEQRWPTVADAIAAAGGAPLSEGDPVRVELAALAAAGAGRRPQLSAPPLSPVPPTTIVSSVCVSPPEELVAEGAMLQLSATAVSAAGATLARRSVEWSSSDPAVATVSPSGLVTAKTVGSVTISAVINGQIGTAAVYVMPAAPAMADFETPPRTSVTDLRATGIRTADIRATGIGATHSPPPMHSPPRESGITRAAPTPSLGGTRPERQPTIGAPRPSEADESAARRGADTAVRRGSPGIWIGTLGAIALLAVAAWIWSTRPEVDAASSASLIPVTVDSASASLRHDAEQIRAPEVASGGDVRGQRETRPDAQVADPTIGANGSAAPPTRLESPAILVSPDQTVIPVGTTVAMRAMLEGDHGNTLPAGAVVWRSSRKSVATVSQGGVVRGVGAGTARIIATSGSRSDTAVVTVTAPVDAAPVGTTPVAADPLADAAPVVDTAQIEAALSAVEEDMAVGRAERDRGEYEEASKIWRAAREQLQGLAGQAPNWARIRQLSDELSAAAESTQAACIAERDIALQRGAEPPVCDQ